MDTKTFKETCVELERIHNRIIETEQEIQQIDIAIDQVKTWVVDIYDTEKVNSRDYRLSSYLSKLDE